MMQKRRRIQKQQPRLDLKECFIMKVLYIIGHKFCIYVRAGGRRGLRLDYVSLITRDQIQATFHYISISGES